MVVRNFTTLDRLRTLIEVLCPESPHIKFVVETGSEFARGLGPHIERLGFEVLTWAEAKITRFDVILAAHATPALGELRGLVFVFPHGAGYNRLVDWSSGSEEYATGLVAGQLMTAAETVIPSAIGVSHQEQAERLRESAPEAAERAVVIGDPVFDRIAASRSRRDEFRERFGILPGQKLIAVTSTWGEDGTVGSDASLPMRLLAQLPMDQYRVLLIMHQNIWFADSPAGIKAKLRDELDSGLLIVPPQTPWEPGLVALDLDVGDHSSLSMYAAAIGCRFLLAADGGKEVVPGSPLAQLCERAIRLDLEGDLRQQIEAQLATPPVLSAEAIANSIFQEQKKSWARFRFVVRTLAGLPDLPGEPRMTPVGDPQSETGRRITAWVVSTRAGRDDGTVLIERYPRIARESWAGPDEDVCQVVDDAEVDETTRSNGEILLRSHPITKVEGEKWVDATLTRSEEDGIAGGRVPTELPNACVAAYRHAHGCAVRWRGGPRIDVACDDVFAAATVLHRRWLDGDPLDRPGCATYCYRPGEVEHFGFAPAP